MDELKGTVVKLHCQFPNFCAGRVQPPGGGREVSFSGKIHVCLDQVVQFKGEYVVNAKYGRQFNVSHIVSTRELDADGIVSWLEHRGAGIGIGPVKAKRIVGEFGADFARVLMEEPERVATCAKVPLEGVVKLAEYFKEHQEEVRVYAELAALGLTDFLCTTLIKKYKAAAVGVVKENPYRLADEVKGIGFAKADEIAANVGIHTDHPARIRAAVLFALAEVEDQGSTCCTLDKLVDESTKLLNFKGADDRAVTQIAASVADGDIFHLNDAGRELYATPELAACERNVAGFLKTYHAPRDWGVDIEAGIARHGDFLDDDQKNAVRMALTQGCVIVTGPAGSGKTTVINTIVKILEDRPNDLWISLCAPTGKAARRMEEVIGRESKTIHRLLEYRPPNEWVRDAENPLDSDVIIADETSMIDSILLWRLMQSVRRRAALILVGDHHQLPPVGAGAFLRDAIQNKLLPVADLHQVHRNAGALRQNSAKILHGEIAPTAPRRADGKPEWVVIDNHVAESTLLPWLDKMFLETLPGLGYDPIKDVQFMTPRRKGISLCAEMLSERFQVLHQRRLGREVPPTPPKRRAALYPGDKVIQTKNNYMLDVMNGTLGIVVDSYPKLVVKFDTLPEPLEIPNDQKGDIDLAYWLTVHKMQGAQTPVAVFLCWSTHLGGWDAPMLHRNLAYTAATRARECAFVIGDAKGVRGAMERVSQDKRLTLLPVFAKESK